MCCNSFRAFPLILWDLKTRMYESMPIRVSHLPTSSSVHFSSDDDCVVGGVCGSLGVVLRGVKGRWRKEGEGRGGKG